MYMHYTVYTLLLFSIIQHPGYFIAKDIPIGIQYLQYYQLKNIYSAID